MGKLAFVFSGQGDQYPGMGKKLQETYPEANRIFSMCDRIRPGTSAQCFEGTEQELSRTENTQPCLYAMELACASVLTQKGIRPAGAAGFSLGEITAAAFCGIFDEETGFRLVTKRGELMQQAAEQYDTAMAAVVKLPAETVSALCSRYSNVYPVNYNSPGQTTVSGLRSEIADFSKDVKEAGGRAIVLRVNGAFHSPFMKEASAAFSEELTHVTVHRQQKLPLYSDLTGEIYGEDPCGLLAAQICNPVQWEKLIRNMIHDGFDTFVEIGPGKTLVNLIRKIDPQVDVSSAEDHI